MNLNEDIGLVALLFQCSVPAEHWNRNLLN